MLFDLYGLAVESPKITFFLRTPWRASALEHRLFDAISQIIQATPEKDPEEIRLSTTDPKVFKQGIQAVARILMGWQEDADPAMEKRNWRWMVEGDTDHGCYDHTGEPFALWGFLRLSIERGGIGESDKGEDIDLEEFGIRIHTNRANN